MRGVGLVGNRRGFFPTWWLVGRLCPGLKGGPRVAPAPWSVAPLLRVSPAISCQKYVSRMCNTPPYLGV